MSEPITWRNVTGPSLADAARPLFYAQQAMQSGTDSLASALKDYQQGQKEIWKQQDADATNQRMALLYGAKTPEELAALQSSGQLAQTVAPNGARIDLGIINKAMDGREQLLQDRAIKGVEFKNAMLDEQQAPLIREIQMLSLKDEKAAQALLDQHPEIRKGFELATGIDTRRWLQKERGWKENDEAFKEKERPLKLQQMRDASAASQASTLASNTQVLNTQLAAVEKRLLEGDSSAGSNAGKEKIDAWLKTVKDDNKRMLLEQSLGAAMKSGAYDKLSAAQVISGLQDSIDTSNWFKWSDNTGETLRGTLDQIKNNDSSVEKAVKAANRQAELEKMRAGLLDKLYPGLAGTFNRPVPGVTPEAGKPGQGQPGAGAAAQTNQPGAQSQGQAQAQPQASAPVETPAEKLARQEKEIRTAYAAPVGYETPYDRLNRENRMNAAIDKARFFAADPQAAADRAAMEATGNAIGGVVDTGIAYGPAMVRDALGIIPRLAGEGYDRLAIRPMRAMGINASNPVADLANSLFVPQGSSGASLSPAMDAVSRRRRAALLEEAKKLR